MRTYHKVRTCFLYRFYLAAGGHGVPPGDVATALSDVDGDDPGLDDPEEDPELDDPFELLALPPEPGISPHGDPLGLVPGTFELFGFTVAGEVLVPGVAGLVELAPGTLAPALGVAVPACGVAVPAGGVAVPAGGVAVCAGGVAVPGAWV